MESLRNLTLRMRWKFILVVLITVFTLCAQSEYMQGGQEHFENSESLSPTVMITLLVRNKAHVLPYSLEYLTNLDYPKNRMMLWIRSDHNSDNSTGIIKAWLDHVREDYHHVDFLSDDSTASFADEQGPLDWSHLRFQHIINLRQAALDAARQYWADYLFMWDVDTLLTNPQTLKNLMLQKKTIVAPMLNATASDYYSNYWGAMDDSGYYQRSDDYFPILYRHIQGCRHVAMVHTCLLINMRHTVSQHLAYRPVPPEYSGPFDDIIIFAHSAKHHKIPMYLLNDDFYGFLMVPMQSHNTLPQEQEQFSHVLLENTIYDNPLTHLEYIPHQYRAADLMGFDQIYLINLKRRPDRREKMMECFRELGIQAKFVDAVDGKELNETYLLNLGIRMLDGYLDPYAKRPITMGEIGCFLSHYFIWKDVVENNYQKIIIFEDDLRFEPYFRAKLQNLMHQIDTLNIDWDLIYLGRKRLNMADESWVQGAQNLVWADYSYWTLSYMLSYSGAIKLLTPEPLGRMIPVDEYLPIMFDKHPTDDWRNAFDVRNLKGLSVEPLLIYPTHYTGEPGYITDTESSEVISDVVEETGIKGDVGDWEEGLQDGLNPGDVTSQGNKEEL